MPAVTRPAVAARPAAALPAVVAVTLVAVAAATVLTACHRPPPPPPPAPAPSGPRAPADVVVLTDVDPTVRTDIRYATAHNFVGRPLDGYPEPLCLLTRAAAEALRRVQAAALADGHTLKVYDCYRPQRAADDMVAWAGQPGESAGAVEFHPRVPKSELFAEGYLGAPTAHSRGSTVDLTLVRLPAPTPSRYPSAAPPVPCTAPPQRRYPDDSVDMGTGFDCFDPLAATAATDISRAARANRALLRRLMTDGGFVNYDREWWHYRLADEPYPDTYFDFPVSRSAVR
ncbi:M15 family metallopeptidase [Micromonospora rosaria]|uniref:M15 family metallopeptidase n=1 Tax=Micromonospora rosaria TaxID=47874 RepID=UPI0037C5F58C